MSFAARVRTLGAPLRSPSYRRIWAAQVLSDLGDYAGLVALSMLVFSHTRSATMATLTLAIAWVPWLGPGQLLAALCDRYPRRNVLVVCDLARALLYLGLCVPMPVPALWVLAFAAGLSTPPFSASRTAALAELVTSQERVPAFRLSGITAEAAIVLGGFLGALLLAVLGPVGALLANAASFALSAVLLAGLPPLRVPRTTDGARVGVVEHLRQSAALLWDNRVIRRAAVVGTLAVACGTAVETLAAPHAAQAFPGVSWVAGLILGGMAGVSMLVTAHVPDDEDRYTLMRFAALVTLVSAAVSITLLLSTGALPVTVGFVAVGGMFAALVPTRVIIAARLPAGRRATCFSVLAAATALEQVVLSSAAGPLADRLGTGPAAALICLPAAVVALGVLLTPARDRDPAVDGADVLAYNSTSRQYPGTPAAPIAPTPHPRDSFTEAGRAAP